MLLSVVAGMEITSQAVPKTKDIYLTVTAPKADQTVNKNASDSNGGTVFKVMWFDLNVSTTKALKDNATFVAGHKYQVVASVKAPTGYVYDTTYTDGYVNGLKGSTIKYPDYGNDEIAVVYSFGELSESYEYVSTIDITGSISAGTTLQANTLKSSTKGVDSVSVIWTHDGVAVNNGTTVTFGDYAAIIAINIKKGFYIGTTTKVNVFGQSISPAMDGGYVNGAGNYMLITSPTIHVNCKHTVSAGWKTDFDNHWQECVNCKEKFSLGAHDFDAGTTVGNITTYTCQTCGYKKELDNGSTAITVAMRIVDETAVAGNAIPAYYQLQDNYREKATVTGAKWYKGSIAPANEVAAGTKFEDGQTYYMVETIKAYNNMYFDYDPADINDGRVCNSATFITNAEATEISGDKKTMTATFSYVATKSSDLTVTLPQAEYGITYGEIVDYIVANRVSPVAGKNVSVTFRVYDEDLNIIKYEQINYNTETGVYEAVGDTTDADVLRATKLDANTAYELAIYMPTTGYVANNHVKVNEGNAYAYNAKMSSSGLALTVYAYYNIGSNQISLINLSGIKAPVAKATPSTAYTVGNRYGIVKGAMKWDTSKAFECGKNYKATITLTADDGFSFASKVITSIDDSSADVTTKITGNTATITIAYAIPNHIYDEGTVVKAATCTETGISSFTCLSCGDKITDTTDKVAHTTGVAKVTPATTEANGKSVVKCSVCGEKISSTTIYKIADIKLAKTSVTYNGKAQKPAVTVTDSKGIALKKGTDYTVKYSDNKKVGVATAKVTFKGNYSGTKKLTFKVKPKKSKITKLTPKKKGFKATWKKITTQTTGYQIQYATDKKFKKNKKTVTVKKNKTTSKTIKKLKAKKTYYVRIRTYKTVKVNGKNKKIYSAWSKAVKVKTKK
jgi:hypothetical protein